MNVRTAREVLRRVDAVVGSTMDEGWWPRRGATGRANVRWLVTAGDPVLAGLAPRSGAVQVDFASKIVVPIYDAPRSHRGRAMESIVELPCAWTRIARGARSRRGDGAAHGELRGPAKSLSKTCSGS